MYLFLMFITFGGFAYCVYKDYNDSTIFLFFCSLALLVLPFMSYQAHIDDIATVRAQHLIIDIQEDRIGRLNNTLNAITVPDGGVALMNADSPISSLVKELSLAENELALAKITKADSQIDIVARKLGVFSFVTWFVDDIEPEKDDK